MPDSSAHRVRGVLGLAVMTVLLTACESENETGSEAGGQKDGAKEQPMPDTMYQPSPQSTAGGAGNGAGDPGSRQGEGLYSGEKAQSGEPSGDPERAVAELSPRSGSDVTGEVVFTEDRATEAVRLRVQVNGLSPGKHGFHIHARGDCSAGDASTAGGHYNPDGFRHGSPENAEHHAGDLGNLTAGENGAVDTTMTFDHLALSGDESIIGRAVIVHGAADDFTSQPSGDAGERVGCGVIESGRNVETSANREAGAGPPDPS